MRLFFAIPLEEKIKKEIVFCLEAAGYYRIPGASFVPENNLHITLHFLGERNEFPFSEGLEPLSSVKPLLKRPTEITLDRQLHSFSRRGGGATHFIGIKDGSEFIEKVKRALEYDLISLGIIKRPSRGIFSPHITIGRRKRGEGRYDTNYHIRPISFEVSSVILYSSILDPKGAIYKVEASL